MVSLGWSGTNSWELGRPKSVAAQWAGLKCQNSHAIYTIRKQNSIKSKA